MEDDDTMEDDDNDILCRIQKACPAIHDLCMEPCNTYSNTSQTLFPWIHATIEEKQGGTHAHRQGGTHAQGVTRVDVDLGRLTMFDQRIRYSTETLFALREDVRERGCEVDTPLQLRNPKDT